MKGAARGLAIVALVVITGLCVCMLAVMPSLTFSSLASNRIRYQEVMTAARFADNNRAAGTEWPSDRMPAAGTGSPDINFAPRSRLTSEDACPGFNGAETDRFVLSTWRSNDFDCLAYPSGLHTFELSVWNYVFGSVGMLAAILLSMILVCVWAIRRLLRGPKVRIAA